MWELSPAGRSMLQHPSQECRNQWVAFTMRRRSLVARIYAFTKLRKSGYLSGRMRLCVKETLCVATRASPLLEYSIVTPPNSNKMEVLSGKRLWTNEVLHFLLVIRNGPRVIWKEGGWTRKLPNA